MGSVWISYRDGAGNIVAQGAAVNGVGAGAIGPFTPPQASPGSNGGNFGGIAVGPTGKAIVTYQKPVPGPGPSTIYVNVNNGLAGPAFAAQVFVTNTNVGGFAGVPAQPARPVGNGIDAEANVAWDHSGGPHSGRVYLVYTDRPMVASVDTDIFVVYSDMDGGAGSWSLPSRVNDDPPGNGQSQFNPAIAVDQWGGGTYRTAGYVAFTWYDCRNSAANNTAQIYGTVSDGSTSPITGQLIIQPNVQIGANLVNAHAVDPMFDFGDYDTMDFANGYFWRTWADDTVAGNPDGLMEMATAQVCVIILPPPVTASSRLVLARATALPQEPTIHIATATAVMPLTPATVLSRALADRIFTTTPKEQQASYSARALLSDFNDSWWTYE